MRRCGASSRHGVFWESEERGERVFLCVRLRVCVVYCPFGRLDYF